ncbi:MAG: hypothetical protein KatS3mg031_1304 [Chitinophagales bacterium]|nr:MAG: hypothetical protein KatS3mg031_1304 [Chitinophagales bacterium]
MARMKSEASSVVKAGVLLFCFLTCGGVQANAQSDSVVIIRDARLDSLVERYTHVHQQKQTIPGYRIQIIASPNRKTVFDTKSEFVQMFPDMKTFVVFQAPNFKLRAGNYRNRLDAYRDLQKIGARFKGAFIVRDEIKLTEL